MILRMAVALVLVVSVCWSWSAARAGVILHEDKPSDLYILSIGIDEYEAPLPTLQFAKADAEAFAAALANTGRSAHTRVFTHVLLDEAATPEGIDDVFQKLVTSVTPDDTFVFFFAGMGHSSAAASTPSTKTDDFFLLTHKGTDHLDGTSLKSRFRQIQARNKLIVIDSCYGALFFEETVAAAALEGGRRNASATGVNLMLMGTDGLAYEDPRLRHGTLTAALLDGLKGPADIDGNGSVTAWELEAFLPYRLFQIRTISDFRARSSSLGRDFAIGSIRHTANDWTPPEVRLVTPATGAEGSIRVPPGTLFISGQATDASGVKKVTVNGTAVPIGPGGAFHATVGVAPAASVVEIVAEDGDRNASSLVLTLEGGTANRGAPDENPGRSRGGEPMAEPVPAVKRPPRRDYAVLFATDEYSEWAALKNPTFDAEVIADRLRDTYGFDVRLVKNPDTAAILDTVVEYQKREYGPDDQLLVFVAGHGFYDDRWSDGFLVSRNSPAQITTNNFGAFLQHASVFRMIDAIPCAHILLVVDACFGGQMLESAPLVPAASGRRGTPGGGRWARGNPAVAWSVSLPALFPTRQSQPPAVVSNSPSYGEVDDDELVRRKLRGKSRKLLTSGGKEYVPDGRPGRHSPFAARFIEALASRGLDDQVLTTDELYGFVERVDPEPRRGRFTADSVGEFVFVAKKRAPSR